MYIFMLQANEKGSRSARLLRPSYNSLSLSPQNCSWYQSNLEGTQPYLTEVQKDSSLNRNPILSASLGGTWVLIMAAVFNGKNYDL